MSKTDKINIRIDPELKREFIEGCEENFTNASHQITMFIYKKCKEFQDERNKRNKN